MSSLPVNAFVQFSTHVAPTRTSTQSVWAQVKLLVASLREAWQPEQSHEPRETYMGY